LIGAKKLNKQDAAKIRKLVAQGLNDAQIARQFISENGSSVSREHIRSIRVGDRWNEKRHSFVMKEDLNDLPMLKTEMNGMVFETQVGWLKTKTLDKWFLWTLINDEEVDGPMTFLMDEKPSMKDILQFHKEFVSIYL
jgi:hypothetical protein